MPTLNQVRRKLERYSVTQSEMSFANMMAYFTRKEDAQRDGTPIPYDKRFEDVCKLLSSSSQLGICEEAVFSPTPPKKPKTTKLRGVSND